MKRILSLASGFLMSLMLFPATLLAQCPVTGDADVVISQTGVTNPNNALGSANGSSAQLYDSGDQIVLDLTDAIPSGEDYTIRWRKDPGTSGNPNMTVEESSNGSSWSAASGSAFTLTNTSYYDQTITASTTTRYLRFTNNNVYNVDLDAVSYTSTTISGDADVVVSQSGVVDPGNALGAPDATRAQLWDNGDQMVLDLTDEIPTGEDYTIRWRRDPGTGSTPSITVEESSNGSSWSAAAGSPFAFNNTSYFDQTITASTNTRYLRFVTQNVYNVDLDAVSYNVSCGGAGGGTFSCTGGLLTNPEFEAGDLSGWWTNGTVAITGDAQFGSKAAIISGGSGGVGDNLAASPGQTYSLSAYAKSTGSANVVLEFLDASWSNISSNYANIATGSYQEYTIQATAPANTAYVQVMAWQNAGGGSTTVDGYCLTLGAAAPTFSCSGGLLTNPEFESGSSSWNTYGSQNISNDSYYGSNAIQFTDGSGAGADQTIAVTPGRIYTMEGYAKVNGQSSTNAILKFYDASMNQIAYHDAIIDHTSYGYFSLSGMAAPNAAFVRPSLWKPSGGGTANYDGICFDSYAGNPVSCASGCDISPSFSDYVWSHENEQSNDDWMDYDNGDLTFCDNGDGTFSIIGTVIGGVDAEWDGPTAIPCGADDSWELNLTISDKQDWATFGGSYVQTTGCGANHVNWDYWDISGTLTGTGCNTGRTITNVRPATGYRLQVGTGGNSQSCNFGLSTWLYGEENGNTIDLDFYAHIDETCYDNLIATTPLDCSNGIFNNPEFESDYSNWTTSGSTSITGDSYFGSKAAYITGGTNGGGFWQFQPASQGDQFEASVYGKVTGGSSAALGILFYDASYNILNSQYQTFTNTSYTEITISSVVAPANTAYVRVSGWKNSGGNGTATFDGFCVEPVAPPAPQTPFTCDNKKYQSIELSGDYWLYEVETNPVNLTPLFNMNAAGAVGGLNAMVFDKQDGYIYIVNMTAPWNLYRIGSDMTIQNMGGISGFPGTAYINAADVDANGDIIYKSHDNTDRNLELYKLNMSTMTVTQICDYPFFAGHRNNVGDFAVNPQNGKYYGTWDSTSLLVEIDPTTCVMNEITTNRWFPGANGAFWVSADGTGYGYENFTGNLTEINLTTGDVEIIGTGATTSQTDGCSCEALKFQKTVSVDTATVGDTVTYTFTIFNNWTTALTNITFSDTLTDGLIWASEPFNLTGGVTVGITAISGTTLGDFTITGLPVGTTSFDIKVAVPDMYSGGNPYMNQAFLDDLPALIGAARPSDYPVTPSIDDATPLYIFAPTGCDNYYKFNWNNGAGSGFSWDLTNGEASVVRNTTLSGMGGSTMDVDVTLTNSDGVNIDEANCTTTADRYYTATCDADFAGSACPGGSEQNFGCNYLTMGMTSVTNDDAVSMTFDFDSAVQISNMSISDIDYNQVGVDNLTWQDAIEIRASYNGSAIPVMCTFKGSDVLSSQDSSSALNIYARAMPDWNGELDENALEGTLTFMTMGAVNSLTITLKNGFADDGVSDGLGIRISSFDICGGSPNEVPVAVMDTFSVRKSTVLDGDVLDDNGFSKDFHGDKPLARVTKISDPVHGAVTLNNDGTFNYTPNSGYIGRDYFLYEIEDANGDISNTRVVLHVNGFTDADQIGDIMDIDDDNDGILDIMETCLDTAVQYTNLTVEVLTDAEPFELTWEMVNPDGKKVKGVKNGHYKQAGQWHTQNMQVIMSGAYRFSLEDLFGDGMGDDNGRMAGGYKIKVNGVEKFNGIPGFGHKTVHEIEVEDEIFKCQDGDPSADNDDDGIVNFRDIDYCVLNVKGVCANMDSDVDGIPDYLDLDSDNDGIPDNIEAQKTQSFVHPLQVDADKDGLDDAYDKFGEGARLASEGILPVDTDNDGTPDYLDLDSDGDGFLDSLESGLTMIGIDVDADGLDDGVDLTIDYRDPFGIISHTALLPDEDGDVILFGGDVDFRDILGGALPVELVEFNADANGSDVDLSWSTASELNNDFFAVQRSIDGVNFEVIEIVEGYGTTSEAHSYTTVDANLNAGLYYYRLEQFDFDGTSEFSPVRTARITSTNGRSVSIYPNPAKVNGDLSVEGLGDEPASIQVTDMSGRTIGSLQVNNSRVDLSVLDLNNGIYLIDVIRNNGTDSFKLIVQD